MIASVFSSLGTLITEVAKLIFSAWLAILSSLLVLIGKAVHFGLWMIAGVFIVPCVFIAGNLYPKWEKWGEKF